MTFTPLIDKKNVMEESLFVWQAWWPIVISFAYLFLVYYTQKAKILKPIPQWFALVYNIFITVISAVLVIGMSWGTYVAVKDRGEIYFLLCEARDKKFYNKDLLLFWCIMYWCTKIVELADTFLKIANGSNVIFLHVFHHAVMVVAAWQSYYYDYSMNWLTAGLNSFVHVVMYGYYVHVVWNKMNGQEKPKWGIYVTYIQLIQFWMGATYFVVMIINILILGIDRCYNTSWSLFLVLALNIFFISQFTAFFFRRWRKGKKGKKGKGEKKEE